MRCLTWNWPVICIKHPLIYNLGQVSLHSRQHTDDCNSNSKAHTAPEAGSTRQENTPLTTVNGAQPSQPQSALQPLQSRGHTWPRWARMSWFFLVPHPHPPPGNQNFKLIKGAPRLKAMYQDFRKIILSWYLQVKPLDGTVDFQTRTTTRKTNQKPQEPEPGTASFLVPHSGLPSHSLENSSDGREESNNGSSSNCALVSNKYQTTCIQQDSYHAMCTRSIIKTMVKSLQHGTRQVGSCL